MKEAERTKADCLTQVSDIKKKVQDKEKAADEYMEKAKKLEEKATKLKNRISEEIDAESNRKISKKANALKAEYKTKIKGIYALLVGSIIYGFFVTILQMCLSERIKRDCMIILYKTEKVLSPFFEWIGTIFEKLWDIRNIIGNEVAGVIIAIKYLEEIGDYITVAFHLILLAIIVWLSDYFGFIGCTLLTVWFWINVVYVVVRIVIYMKDIYW